MYYLQCKVTPASVTLAQWQILEKRSFTSSTTKRTTTNAPPPSIQKTTTEVEIDVDADDFEDEDIRRQLDHQEAGSRRPIARAVTPPPSYKGVGAPSNSTNILYAQVSRGGGGGFDQPPPVSRSPSVHRMNYGSRGGGIEQSLKSPPTPSGSRRHSFSGGPHSRPPSPGPGSRRATLEGHYSQAPSPMPYVEETNSPYCFKGGRGLQVVINMVLLTASLLFIGTGAGLMGFYRVHMLEVVSIEFLLVPLIMVVGGVATLLTALFGFYVTMREDSCLTITYAVFLAIEVLLMLAGVGASIRLLFDIQTGLLDADVIAELANYETSSYVRYKWDTLQREFSCCGAYDYTMGYTDWKHTLLGSIRNSVPDSCCLQETPRCGRDVFTLADLRVVMKKIHTHGCITTLLRRLDSHVVVILIVFAIAGAILAIIEMLGVVLSCCMASYMAAAEREEWALGGPGGFYDEYEDDHTQQPRHQPRQRPVTPQTMMSNDVSSHHETAF